MINRYKYRDPVFRENTKYPNIRVTSVGNNSLLRVFRLITGTLDCKDEFSRRNYKFRDNYSNLPISVNASVKQVTVSDNFEEEVTLNTLNKYFLRARSNQNFYSAIEAELLKLLIAEKNNNHLEAFFYLYRVIEGISYSIPLIYASRSKKYNKSYKLLQSFFANEQAGELKFFKKFITDVYKDEHFYKTSITIDFNEIDIEELREKYYTIYLNKMDDRQIKDKTESEEIDITFLGFFDFIIVLRNRFFHYSQGTWQENLSSTDIIYPDFFFKPIIKHGINWISIILFEIINNDFSNERGV